MTKRTRPAPGGGASTVRDVAARAGVSASTVSRVLAKSPIPGHTARRGGPGTAGGRAGAYREESNA
ncbi:LacI family DNA-binding transcriptional regulator [Streptomyces sp. NPDC021562]|uniref:LacI family DNA-binding transcriptional regulator n=1 Tax=Streptomyces sp. NPDC021562 TaxID=3155121 RepID=UPI0033CB4D14